jgi:DNA-binding response OmpR family regulator
MEEARATILVVDDDPGVRDYLRRMLTRDGYHVATAESGEAALEHVDNDIGQSFDLALIDLKMPGIDGMEVLAALRRVSPDTAAIVLTAHGSLETAVAALRQGAYDYLFKPCKAVEIRESVQAGLYQRQRDLRQRAALTQLQKMVNNMQAVCDDMGVDVLVTPPSPFASQVNLESDVPSSRFLQRGRWVVDVMRHVITLDGHLLELTPTEFNLLAYIIGEAPRIISPEELAREAMGYVCDATDARDATRTHIYNLRQKIDKAVGCKDVLRTVRGVGYAIDETHT